MKLPDYTFNRSRLENRAKFLKGKEDVDARHDMHVMHHACITAELNIVAVKVGSMCDAEKGRNKYNT